MPLHSTIDPKSPEFARNADVMRGLVDFLVAECCADSACRPASQAKGKAA